MLRLSTDRQGLQEQKYDISDNADIKPRYGQDVNGPGQAEDLIDLLRDVKPVSQQKSLHDTQLGTGEMLCQNKT